jgi:hypothetical protein
VVVCGGLESFAVFRRVGDAMFQSEAVKRSSFVVLQSNQHNIPFSTCVKPFGMTEARGAPSRSPGHADHRREGGRGDPERPLDVPVQVSKHLRVLREVGLVRCRAEGRRRLYRLEPARLGPLHEWLAK